MNLRTHAFALVVALLTTNVAAAADVSVVFSKNEVAIITDYYAQARDSGNGAAKKQKSLPPGIAKNLARGKPMPPGIAKQQLPDDLSRKLPPVRYGYERVVVDGRVLLVELATQVIHDVLMDAVFK